MPTVLLTVDVEPDCPPYLDGWRGIEAGLPLLLDLLRREGVPATFFVTGESAQRYPDAVRDIVERGHEIGCHGWSHTPFPHMSREEADREIGDTATTLRSFGAVDAFRAPYLSFPARYLPLLDRHGFRTDLSLGRHKPAHWPAWTRPEQPPIRRVWTSTTSSVLRLPPAVRDPFLVQLRDPVVLFVHPWEFVDLRQAPIPWDSRLGTGQHALRSLGEVLRLLRDRGGRFRRVHDPDGVR